MVRICQHHKCRSIASSQVHGATTDTGYSHNWGFVSAYVAGINWQMENSQHRTAVLQRDKLNEDERTVPAILSTESPVDRFGEMEILDHTKDAVDLSRAKPNLPLLFAHDQTDFIGAVENVRLSGRQLVGTLRFARNDKADEVFTAVQDKLLRGISIGYLINDSIPTDDGYRATAWEIFEASIAPVQADPRATIQRGKNITTASR